MSENDSIKQQIIEMFRESVIIQSLATILTLSTLCILYLAPLFRPGIEINVPDSLYVITGTILGYWFKAKDRYAQQKMVKAANVSPDSS